MDSLKIAYHSPAALQPRATNPRTHSKKQIRQIADSIERFGFTNPVLIDRNGGIVAGHGRVEAAKLLGLESVPTIRLDDLTEAEIRSYVIADNRLAELAGWDGMAAAKLWRALAGLSLHGSLIDAIKQGAVLVCVAVGDSRQEKRVCTALLRHADSSVQVHDLIA